MKVIITKDYKELSERSANLIILGILKKPDLILGLPSGETPIGMYRQLVKAYKNKKVDFSNVRYFNIDEYYPIKKISKNSSYYYMNSNLLNHVNIKKSNINILDSESKNPEKYCIEYELKIKKTPMDILVLGVGINGHIGFNEPGSKLNSKIRVVNLSNKTIKRNSRFFKKISDVPKSAMTIGISTIMSSKMIILIASGKDKAEAIKHLVKGKVNSDYPVSFLRNHKNLIVILDKQAAKFVK